MIHSTMLRGFDKDDNDVLTNVVVEMQGMLIFVADNWSEMCQNTLQLVCNSFPWQKKEDMNKQLILITARARSVILCGENIPSLIRCVDEMLPVMSRLGLPPAIIAACTDTVTRYLGRNPSSMLEMYQTVYTLRCTNRAVSAMFDSVFFDTIDHLDFDWDSSLS